MFDYVKANPKEDLHMSITSNCCPPKGQWQKFIDSMQTLTPNLDHFMLFASLDSWGKQAEYIRNGLDFDIFYKNIVQYLEQCDKHSLTFIITFNTLSYSGIFNYIQQIHKLRTQFSKKRQMVWFDIPQLTNPDYMNPKLMPERVIMLEHCVDYMEFNKDGDKNEFQGFSDFEINKVKRLINWIKADTGFDKDTAEKNFKLFFNQHDKRRNTKFTNVFPELKEYYE